MKRAQMDRLLTSVRIGMFAFSEQLFGLVQKLCHGSWIPDVPVTLKLDSNLDSFLSPNVPEYDLYDCGG